MPLEQLLLFALLIGIALVERLIRVMRARMSSSPVDEAPDSASERTVLHRRSAVLAEHPLAHLPASATVPPAAQLAAPERLRASGRDGSRVPVRLHRPVAAASLRPSAGPTRHGTARQRVFAHGGLRHGIVLMTILGHCRALEVRNEAPKGAQAQ